MNRKETHVEEIKTTEETIAKEEIIANKKEMKTFEEVAISQKKNKGKYSRRNQKNSC